MRLNDLIDLIRSLCGRIVFVINFISTDIISEGLVNISNQGININPDRCHRTTPWCPGKLSSKS